MRQNPHFWKELRKERKEQRITRQYKDSHTGKSDFERCIAMNNEAINWDDVPDRITKDQLYRICYISKSTARYLLQSGKIPCYYTGKQTRCYQIKKEDVIAYLEDRKLFPQAYAAPKGWYRGRYELKMEIHLPPEVLEDLHAYYASLLASYRDVLTAAEVCKLTGYSKTAVNNWCGSGILKAFKRSNVNHIPKVYLIEFLCSPDCRSITRKSDWHIWTLKRFPAWRRQKQAEGGAE
jgi:hypothetical protein